MEKDYLFEEDGEKIVISKELFTNLFGPFLNAFNAVEEPIISQGNLVVDPKSKKIVDIKKVDIDLRFAQLCYLYGFAQSELSQFLSIFNLKNIKPLKEISGFDRIKNIFPFMAKTKKEEINDKN